jgi:hypothetical protein
MRIRLLRRRTTGAPQSSAHDDATSRAGAHIRVVVSFGAEGRDAAVRTDAAGRFRMDVPFGGLSFQLVFQDAKTSGVMPALGGLAMPARPAQSMSVGPTLGPMKVPPGETKDLGDVTLKRE